MCGIIGYTGLSPALPVLLTGLKALEYRGYDSAGVALSDFDGNVTIVKKQGRLSRLEEEIKKRSDLLGSCGIGHTRWATHGIPSDANAHPHATKHLVLVHNGIIENDRELAELLSQKGYTFVSQTDTEVAAALIDSLYRECGDPLTAIFDAVAMLRGSYAFGVMFKDVPKTVFAIRKNSPLVVAEGKNEALLASDVTAILPYTDGYYRPAENVAAILTPTGVTFQNAARQTVTPPLERAKWSVEQAQKGGFPHFMLKEIFEEPDALRKTITPLLCDGLPSFGQSALEKETLTSAKSIHIVACGTAMHAGLVGKALIEKWARRPTVVDVASEFRYRDPILESGTPVILLSQSGETADTLAALRHAKEKGAKTLGIVNVIGSSVAQEADGVLYTLAGPEIAVASTKAYTVQCAVLCLVAIHTALARGTLTEEEGRDICRELCEAVPRALEAALTKSQEIAEHARRLADAEHLFYIGRGMDHALATEASLKLKEISYIHSEAYAAGELKHGTISLITDGVPVVALVTEQHLAEKTASAIREVKARGAFVLSLCGEALARRVPIPSDESISLPSVRHGLDLFPTATAAQLLAYHTAAHKGLDVDKPRNLAKSVTVE